MNTTQNPSTWNFLDNLGKPRRLLSTLTIAGGLALTASVMAPDALAQTTGLSNQRLVASAEETGI